MRYRFGVLASTVACVSLLAGIATQASAQEIQASPEHKVLQKDVGTWKAELKMWMGPEGKPDPSAPAQTSAGKEENRMLGPFWCISKFSGDFGGMEFQGLAITGYDSKQKKYVGSWRDSISPSPMEMTGTFDPTTQTMKFDTRGVGMDGEPVTGKMVVQYEGEDKRTMTMYDMVDGQPVKSMMVTYTRVK